MVNTRKSSLRLLGSKSPGPGPGPGTGAEPGATGGSSHFISSRTRSSKTRAASCPAAKAGGSGGTGVALDEARVRARRPGSRGWQVPARPPGLCLAGLLGGRKPGRCSHSGGRRRGSAGAVEGGTGREGPIAALWLLPARFFCVKEETLQVEGTRAPGLLKGALGRSAVRVLALSQRGLGGEARAGGLPEPTGGSVGEEK